MFITIYLIAGALFILALRGLSSPASSRRGNTLGMIGMAIAIVTTLLVTGPSDVPSWGLIVGGIVIGGGIGAYLARTIKMTQMPELVAGFHSLVGLAAVCVAAAAFYAPQAFGIFEAGRIHPQSLIEMSLGVAIGAFTFTGSIIAFLKLSGRMGGKPMGEVETDGRKAISKGGEMIHEVGTARMGHNDADSVVNQYGQSWAVANLFVMDGAVLVSSPDKNPTLSILALAWRSADNLATLAKQGAI